MANNNEQRPAGLTPLDYDKAFLQLHDEPSSIAVATGMALTQTPHREGGNVSEEAVREARQRVAQALNGEASTPEE